MCLPEIKMKNTQNKYKIMKTKMVNFQLFYCENFEIWENDEIGISPEIRI